MPGSIAFGRFDDSFSLASFKAYIAEFISTLIFVFAGVGSAIAYCEFCYNYGTCMLCSYG